MVTLASLRVLWARWYYLEYTPGGRYRATRPDGHVLPEADTPEGLDSAIRADYVEMAHPVTGPDEFADRIRVEEFRRQGVTIGEEFGAWNATVPQQDGESGSWPGTRCTAAG